LAEWQNQQLAGLDDIAYLVAMNEDVDGDEPDGDDLSRWRQHHGFEADALLLDPDWLVMDSYAEANAGQTYTQAITVIIDKQMRIRHVGGTYASDHDANLAMLLQLAQE
jgi:hypothetical protein